MATTRDLFDQKQIKDYLLNGKRNLFYKDYVENYKEFLAHSDGEYPEAIIERQRPNEPQIVKEFRKDIWQPITKPTFSRVVSSLGKIRRSSDWGVKYPEESKELSLIKEGETLEDYCEQNFPFFTSVTNWIFSVLMKPYLIDSNAVILIMPIEANVEATSYLRPYPNIFSCIDVLDYSPGQYAILNIPEGSSSYQGGKAIYVVNTSSIQRWEQLSSRTFDMVDEYFHELDMLPAFKLGGIICKTSGYNFMYESRIAGILPNLNESIAEYTDLQAAKRLHVYPERWEYSQHECTACKGAGVVKNPSYRPGADMSPTITCSSCNGLGYNASGPYSKLLVKPTQAGTNQVPTPPAGFIEKDVEIVRIMDESWRRHIYDALAAINFQFLDQTPMNQSGIAKEVDKDELNNTVNAIAEDIVRIMDNIYKITARYRYRLSYSFDQIDEALPSVNVPEHFDLLSSQFMQEEISKAKTGKLNPTIVSALEVEYAGKRFINEPEIKEKLELVLKLDPLPNITEDEKMGMLSNKGVTKIKYIISCNIQSYIQRALEENENFAELELDKQNKILEGYAQEQIDADKKEIEEAMQKMNEINGMPGREVPDENEEIIEEEPMLS
jgi:hypothetical protein